ncbi:hypothetical protein [Spartinivicinus poritis]|uniref:Uncharacterized protein n=1 Tax=Spartinivicinus poritis TaxID=2994640 RepID=A0ABT5UE51_9GAMM|nr:hypothetical protein [Spartinivicinus sp. A2-2]MDE1464647.1 hypothetical protein [Spartinivicinus sp. A2-2]
MASAQADGALHKVASYSASSALGRVMQSDNQVGAIEFLLSAIRNAVLEVNGGYLLW